MVVLRSCRAERTGEGVFGRVGVGGRAGIVSARAGC